MHLKWLQRAERYIIVVVSGVFTVEILADWCRRRPSPNTIPLWSCSPSSTSSACSGTISLSAFPSDTTRARFRCVFASSGNGWSGIPFPALAFGTLCTFADLSSFLQNKKTTINNRTTATKVLEASKFHIDSGENPNVTDYQDMRISIKRSKITQTSGICF